MEKSFVLQSDFMAPSKNALMHLLFGIGLSAGTNHPYKLKKIYIYPHSLSNLRSQLERLNLFKDYLFCQQ